MVLIHRVGQQRKSSEAYAYDFGRKSETLNLYNIPYGKKNAENIKTERGPTRGSIAEQDAKLRRALAKIESALMSKVKI